MESYEKLVALLESMKENVEKFFVKGNKSAGTRVRVAMQKIKSTAQDIRVDIANAKKGK